MRRVARRGRLLPAGKVDLAVDIIPALSLVRLMAAALLALPVVKVD
jgi:hypothetical protein